MKTPRTVVPNMELIEQLCKEKRIKLYQLSLNLKFPRSYIHNASHNKAMIYERVQMIAEYFGVNVESLILKREQSDPGELRKELEKLQKLLHERNEVIQSLNERLKDKEELLYFYKKQSGEAKGERSAANG